MPTALHNPSPLPAFFRSLAPKFLLCAFFFAALPAVLRAQDRRHVTRPVYPPVCVTLHAALTSTRHSKTIPPSDETKPDTLRIQHALDSCPAGHAVELAPDGSRNSFLSGPLDLRSGVTLLVARGAILFASRNPRDYDRSPGSCGVVNRHGHGCKALINLDRAANAGVMGQGVIDGRGWANVLGQKVSWWGLAQQAKYEKLNQNCPRLIQAFDSDNFTLYRIELKNSPNFHVFYSGGDGFTAWGVVIDTPKTARNTDGIDPSSASDVTITHCFIHDGDDDVAIKAGSAGPSSHITVSDNHFYTGHGMSIGSDTNGGVSHVRVSGLTIDGADNGIRIKSNISRGGLVRDVVYRDVCIRDTRNPILMDTHYPFYGKARDLFPDFRDITLSGVRIIGPGKITLDGYSPQLPLKIHFDNVTLADPFAVKILARNAQITLGPGPVNFRPSGPDVQILGKPANAHPTSCSSKFLPFPKR